MYHIEKILMHLLTYVGCSFLSLFPVDIPKRQINADFSTNRMCWIPFLRRDLDTVTAQVISGGEMILSPSQWIAIASTARVTDLPHVSILPDMVATSQ